MMPVAPGYGMLPQQGLPGLQSPPGQIGMEAFAGPGPQEQGMMLGTQPGQVPGVPQAWAMSMWNPAPFCIIKSEIMFLRADFNQPNTEDLVGGLGGPQRIAVQAEVGDDGVFRLADRNLGIDTPYLVVPKLTAEWFGKEKIHSFEASVWASVGPNRFYTVGNNDFPYFITDPTNGAITNAPAAFPDVVDDVRFKYSNQIANLEGMYWTHYTPEQGAVADCAWGIGGRYLFQHEKINLAYRNFVDLDFVDVGRLNARSKNDMFGVQFGAKAVVQSPWKWMRSSLEGKVGLMANDVRNTTEVVDSNLVVDSQARWVRHQFSPLFEAQYNMEFFISQYVTAYAGFHVLYIDRMDRVAQQFNSDLAVFTSEQKNQSDLLLYGPKLGFMMNW